MASNVVVRWLTANDVGSTGTHQSGFLIPKSLIKAGLFDLLPTSELNPRLRLLFLDVYHSEEFVVNYIFYNNKYFGGTRSEYRVTGLSSFVRKNGLKVGDAIEITRIDERNYEIVIKKMSKRSHTLTQESWELIYGRVE